MKPHESIVLSRTPAAEIIAASVKLRTTSRIRSHTVAWAGVWLLLVSSLSAIADNVDDFIEAAMRKANIPGLSMAIIQDGRIIKAKGYGLADRVSKVPVTPTTLFQAGSVSKSVAALGALHLVEQGKLSLDEDVNTELQSWRVPENEFTKAKKVTLRRLLSHSAGLTVHGFPGYAPDKPLPTLAQVLDGANPANTAPIRVDIEPGSEWRYSGGGYTVMQQMIVDVTGEPFPKFMDERVLTEFGMTNSTYAQPLPELRASATATGYYANGKAVEGRWHVYPEMAAAGLWTTPSDLARFAIGIQQSLAGKSNPVISQSMTSQMLSDQIERDGLGVFLRGSGEALRFEHSGRNEGFDSLMVAYATRGQGVAIMINKNDDSGVLERVLNAVALEYHWSANAPNHAAPPGLPEGARMLLNTAYVPNGGERQMLDLYLPATGTNWPLIVWIHGGGWMEGDKEKPPGLGLLRHGFALASINYRFSQDAVFPAQLIDCKAAIRWLRAHALENGIDPTHIGVWGVSAGGHLAALLGTTGGVKEFDLGENSGVSSRVQAVCDWFGPTDLASDPEADTPGSPAVRLIGGPLSQNLEKVQRANPIHYITKDDPPFLIMHGDNDPVVPLQQSQLLADALKKAGVRVSFHIVPGGEHGGPEFRKREEIDRLFVFFLKNLKSD